MIAAPASIAFFATSALKVSIDNKTSGKFFNNSVTTGSTRSNSSFTDISVAPGRELYPPMSINVAPSVSIFSARLKISESFLRFPPS